MANSNKLQNFILIWGLLLIFRPYSTLAKRFDTTMPVSIYICIQGNPAKNASISLLEKQFKEKKNKGIEPKQLSSAITNEKGIAIIELPLTYQNNEGITNSDITAYDYGFSVYHTEVDSFYQPIKDIIVLAICYKNGILDTSKQIRINLLPKIDIDKSKSYLDHIKSVYLEKYGRYQDSFKTLNFYKHIETASKMSAAAAKQKQQELQQLEAEIKYFETKYKQLESNYGYLKKDFNFDINLLKIALLQKEMLASETAIQPIKYFQTRYPIGAISLSSLSDDSFLDIHEYLQTLRFRYKKYNELISTSELKKVRLKVVISIVTYKDTLVNDSNCNSWLLLCAPDKKNNHSNNCTECVSKLRTKDIFEYFTTNCSFVIQLSAAAENYVAFGHTKIASVISLEDDQELVKASQKLLEPKGTTHYQPSKEFSTPTRTGFIVGKNSLEPHNFLIQDVPKKSRKVIVDEMVPASKLAGITTNSNCITTLSNVITFHLLTVFNEKNAFFRQKAKLIKEKMEKISEYNEMIHHYHNLSSHQQLSELLDSIQIGQQDIIWIHYLSTQDDNPLRYSDNSPIRFKVKKARLAIIVFDKINSEVGYNYDSEHLRYIVNKNRLDTAYKQFFQSSAGYIEIFRHPQNSIAAMSVNIEAVSKSYETQLDIASILIYTIQNVIIGTSSQNRTLNWDTILKKASFSERRSKVFDYHYEPKPFLGATDNPLQDSSKNYHFYLRRPSSMERTDVNTSN